MSIFDREQVFPFTKEGFELARMNWFERKIKTSPVFKKGIVFGIMGLMTLDNYLYSKGLMNAVIWSVIVKIRYIFLWIGLAFMLINTSRITVNAYRSHKEGRCLKECVLVACFKFFTPTLANDMEAVLIRKEIPEDMMKFMEKRNLK